MCCGLLACASVNAAPPQTQPARVGPYEPDESEPGLVRMYMVLPCDLLYDSARWQSNMVQHSKEHFEECMKLAETSDYQYADVVCSYVGMQWKFIYVNQKSVEKAYSIMCGDNGVRRNPEYEIHF